MGYVLVSLLWALVFVIGIGLSWVIEDVIISIIDYFKECSIRRRIYTLALIVAFIGGLICANKYYHDYNQSQKIETTQTIKEVK